ncbi:Hypothetical protein PHPALM_20404 [Phytophthora palmivora]|uniref:Uncharacterized protein n=1 Tax=Phytophthora palmivora TaxID=4796 RepID=A0A2P4XEZ7_9STRA|nr:Hypothetical protein PHPALM_20404 [Phytophthora palmivora]
MDERMFARELVRARVDELADMKKTLEDIGTSLEKILRAQVELLSRMEDNEDSSYVLASELGVLG